MSLTVSFKIQPNIKSYDEISEMIEVRKTVFIYEQKFEAELDYDDFDFTCTHIGMIHDGRTIGTARVYLKQGEEYFGRFSILKEFRNKGLGIVLMNEVKRIAKDVLGWNQLILESQIQVVPFYLKCGAIVTGPEYIVQDYPHVPMRIDL